MLLFPTGLQAGQQLHNSNSLMLITCRSNIFCTLLNLRNYNTWAVLEVKMWD